MSILPSFLSNLSSENTVEATATLSIPVEHGINFETGQLTGKMVTGKEAVRVWIWNCLRTERFRYGLYTWQYGVRCEQYIGQTVSAEFLQADCEDEVKEAMMVNPYITDITDFEASFSGTLLNISFNAVTSFGVVEVEYSV